MRCKGCNAIEVPIRYGDDYTGRPLGYRTTHNTPCALLEERRKRARAAAERTASAASPMGHPGLVEFGPSSA